MEEIINEGPSPSGPGVTPPTPPSDLSITKSKTDEGEEDSRIVQHAAKLNELAMHAREMTKNARSVVQRPSLPASLQLCTSVLQGMQARMQEIEVELQV